MRDFIGKIHVKSWNITRDFMGKIHAKSWGFVFLKKVWTKKLGNLESSNFKISRFQDLKIWRYNREILSYKLLFLIKN